MNPTEILAVLEKLAEMMTPMAQETWSILLAQAQAMVAVYQTWGWVLAIVSGLSAIITLIGMWRDPYSGEWPLVIVSLPALIGSVMCFNAAYLRAANPAFYAIQYLLGR